MNRRGFMAGLFVAPALPLILADPGASGLAMARRMNPRGGAIVQRVRGGPFITGERGPEYVVPSQGLIVRK